MRAALVVVALASVALAQTAPAKSATPPRTAGEEFKNVKVLKDVPAAEWFPTMAFISGALGVGCQHCHVNPFASDEKPAKQRAREMMQMVAAINAQNFPEQPNRVTCMTCHNGSTRPARAPEVARAGWVKEYAAATAKPAAPEPAPPVERVLADYRAAIGGRNVARIKSRYYHGTATSYSAAKDGPRAVEQEVTMAGEFARVDLTTKQGTQSNIYDDRRGRGWVITEKETRAMTAEEIAGFQRVAQALQVDYLPRFTQAVLKGAEEMRGHKTWAVELTLSPGRADTYFFDQESGLLVARRGSTQSAFGRFPEETWFEDYQETDGVRLPMTVITAGVNNGIVRVYDEVRLNLPVERKKFEPPAGATGAGD